MYVTFVSTSAAPVKARLVSADGRTVLQEHVPDVAAGINMWMLDLSGVATGKYTLALEANGTIQTMDVIVVR
jgi:hypothetical protein